MNLNTQNILLALVGKANKERACKQSKNEKRKEKKRVLKRSNCWKRIYLFTLNENAQPKIEK
jgi:hypothetical protein